MQFSCWYCWYFEIYLPHHCYLHTVVMKLHQGYNYKKWYNYSVKQIFLFICAFLGETCCKLKNILLGKPPLESKNIFFNLFTLVYVCRDSSSDSSTLVFFRLDLSSGLSALVKWLIYSCLHSSTPV